jgi:hypothetical protein
VHPAAHDFTFVAQQGFVQPVGQLFAAFDPHMPPAGQAADFFLQAEAQALDFPHFDFAHVGADFTAAAPAAGPQEPQPAVANSGTTKPAINVTAAVTYLIL